MYTTAAAIALCLCVLPRIDLVQHGLMTFDFTESPVSLEVHIFKATEFTGEITESEEMRPEWFDVDAVPYDRMWKDDALWFPLLHAGKYFKGHCLFRCAL